MSAADRGSCESRPNATAQVLVLSVSVKVFLSLLNSRFQVEDCPEGDLSHFCFCCSHAIPDDGQVQPQLEGHSYGTTSKLVAVTVSPCGCLSKAHDTQSLHSSQPWGFFAVDQTLGLRKEMVSCCSWGLRICTSLCPIRVVASKG